MTCLLLHFSVQSKINYSSAGRVPPTHAGLGGGASIIIIIIIIIISGYHIILRDQGPVTLVWGLVYAQTPDRSDLSQARRVPPPPRTRAGPPP